MNTLDHNCILFLILFMAIILPMPSFFSSYKKKIQLDTVAYACNPALWEAEAGGSPEVRNLRPA